MHCWHLAKLACSKVEVRKVRLEGVFRRRSNSNLAARPTPGEADCHQGSCQEEEEGEAEPRHHRPVGCQPPWPCSSEPRVPRPNSDAHHFFQFGPFFRLPTHGTMDKRINLELRGRQPAEVSWGLVGFFRWGIVDRWGSRWGRLGGPAWLSPPPASICPHRLWGVMKRELSQVMVWVEVYLGM